MEQTNPQPNPPVTPQIPTNPPVTSPSKNRSILIVLLVVLMVILSSLVTYLLVKSLTPTKPLPAPIAQVNPTPSPVDETANWKTYTNKENNYRLLFPPDWTLDDTTTPAYPEIVPPNEGPNNEARIVLLVNTAQGSLNQFMEEINPATGTKNSQVFLFDKNLVIGGETAILTHGGCCGFFGIQVFFQHQGKTYQIVLKGPPENPQQVYKAVFDQILSTFKFLDNNPVEKCTSDKDCPDNTFCDYSRPGGMGPNGLVTGQPYGSQKCIIKCQNNDQCLSKQCQIFEIVGGDINTTQKGCKP